MSTRFPERLRALRKKKHMSQEELGRLCGVGGPAVHRWETGQTEPDLETLRHLAAIFGQTLDGLCGDGPEAAETENLALMTRAFRQLTAEEQEKLLAVGRTLFGHAFGAEEPGNADPGRRSSR